MMAGCGPEGQSDSPRNTGTNEDEIGEGGWNKRGRQLVCETTAAAAAAAGTLVHSLAHLLRNLSTALSSLRMFPT